MDFEMVEELPSGKKAETGVQYVRPVEFRSWEPDSGVSTNPEISLNLLEMMLKIRQFDKLAVDLSKKGISPGSVHPYVGQEAIAAGACSATDSQDFITSTHRGHGHCLARGGDPYRMFAELLGKADGYAKGKGGSMHIADVKGGNLGANGIAGGGVPIAVGAALASWSLQDSASVSIAFFGDGASNEGSVHEAINFAAAMKLPCVFVCENNLYSISVGIQRAAAQPDISARAVGYGVPGYLVDGQDCLAVRAAALQAVDWARSGNGPSLIECKTYSYLGHSTFSQPPKTKEEMAAWTQRDPIAIHEARCKAGGLINDDGVTELTTRVEREMAHALDEASRAAPAPVDSMLEDVWVSMRQVAWGS